MDRRRRVARAAAAGILLAGLVAGPAAAHERRDVGPYTISVGFIGEPIYAGTLSGLELRVTRDDEPINGLSDSLDAEVRYGDLSPRPLAIQPIFQQPGSYESTFVPTAAGNYRFRIFGDIEGLVVDETFDSANGRFDGVKDAGEAQYPIGLPPLVEVAVDAEQGRAAAEQMPLALGLAATGVVLGLASIGLVLAGRSRALGAGVPDPPSGPLTPRPPDDPSAAT